MHKGLCALYLSKLLSLLLRARVFPRAQAPPPADRIETDGVEFGCTANHVRWSTNHGRDSGNTGYRLQLDRIQTGC